MSREGDLMRKALKRFLLPEVKRLGFSGSASKFQRTSTDWLDLLSIQYWKYGGEFVLEFARRERGALHTSWGEVIPEERLDVAYVNPLQRARLEQRGPASEEGFRGFKFSGFGEDIARYEALASEVAALLPQVDEWLQSGTAGEHIHAFYPRT
jgi:hypothetical protein